MDGGTNRGHGGRRLILTHEGTQHMNPSKVKQPHRQAAKITTGFSARAWLFGCLALWICLQMAGGSRAVAQGTMGAVPDPISARELDRYADRLGLSQQQRIAVEEFHTLYREEFRVLRESDIEKFLAQTRGMQAGFSTLRDRKAVVDG